MVGRALMHAFLDDDSSRLLGLSLRFAAPVLPGDRLRIELWRDDTLARFRVTVPARGDLVVLDQGEATLA